MAIASKGATFPALTAPLPPPHSRSLSNAPPMSFKPTSPKPEAAAAILASAKASFSSLRGGAGLLERPTFDQSQFYPTPEAEEGGDIGRVRDRKGASGGESYRVLLIDDARHTEKLVEKALPQAVPSVTVSDARKLFHESRQNGVAVVIVTVKEHAEFYVQMMIRRGLRSAIEPDSTLA